MLFHHKDFCTLLKNEEDRDILTRKLFDVNLRLFSSSYAYRAIILQCCKYLQWCAQTEKEGYKKPHGYSGANAGIPFNIIALADGTVMVNPKVNPSNAGYMAMKSNCGSLMLEDDLKIIRHKEIKVDYLGVVNGELVEMSQTGFLPTVQHEVDHNNGILITDRRV